MMGHCRLTVTEGRVQLVQIPTHGGVDSRYFDNANKTGTNKVSNRPFPMFFPNLK